LIGAFGRHFREFVDVHIAGGYATPRRGNADLGFFEVCLAETDGVKHGATGRLFDTVDNDG
jgi:hypothetical protein